jgi:hypothetical protein
MSEEFNNQVMQLLSTTIKSFWTGLYNLLDLADKAYRQFIFDN